MPFIEILLPTGHREKLEINANATLISVLEDVCLKRGLNVDNCYLTYNKNKVDLSLKFGMSRLLNNAKLDLIESSTSLVENSNVDVVLQLTDASRVNNSFCPKESLFSIIENFAMLHTELKSVIFPQDTELTLVVFHLHDQIVGEYCLKNTTLASLGVRMGRILFRLEFKKINEEEKFMFDEITRLRIEKCLSLKLYRQNQERSKCIETVVDPVITTVVTQENRTLNYPVDIMADDDFTPFSTFTSTNVSIFFSNNRQKEAPVHQKQAQTLGELLGINLDHEAQPDNYESQNFLNFKFPEIANDNESMKEEIDDDSNRMVAMEDRESVLYQHKPTEDISDSGGNIDVPETFFELTENDLRNIIQSYRNVAESDNPLMTNALREEMREKRFSKYQRCIIQFHFMDAYILQSVFKPRETVEDMYGFIKQFFRNNNSTFHLYTSPPKEILKNKEKNLIQSDLVPMCKVYVSVNAKDLFNNVDQLLSGDEMTAREIIQKWMTTDLGEPIVCGTSGPGRHDKGGTSGNARKMPKWFKSGK